MSRNCLTTGVTSFDIMLSRQLPLGSLLLLLESFPKQLLSRSLPMLFILESLLFRRTFFPSNLKICSTISGFIPTDKHFWNRHQLQFFLVSAKILQFREDEHCSFCGEEKS